MIQHLPKVRESRWELMRIVAMLMIVSGHCLGQSGFYAQAAGWNAWMGAFVGSGSRIAVNVFLFLGCWFMVDAPFRARRVVRLYLEVWCYVAPITLVVVLLGFPVPLKDIVRGIFPFLGKTVWFASAYLALLLFSPWLQKILAWPRRSLRLLLFVGFALTSFWVTVYTFDRTEDQWLDILVWFSFSYLFVGYYKRYLAQKIRIGKWKVLALTLLLYVVLVGTSMTQTGLLHKLANAYLGDYKTIPNVLCAMGLFYFFQHTELGCNRVINWFAASAFAVYIIHQTPAFIPVLWKRIFQSEYWTMSSYSVGFGLLVVFTVYFGCTLIDHVRKTWVEPRLINNFLIEGVECWIDGIYADALDSDPRDSDDT